MTGPSSLIRDLGKSPSTTFLTNKFTQNKDLNKMSPSEFKLLSTVVDRILNDQDAIRKSTIQLDVQLSEHLAPKTLICSDQTIRSIVSKLLNITGIASNSEQQVNFGNFKSHLIQGETTLVLTVPQNKALEDLTNNIESFRNTSFKNYLYILSKQLNDKRVNAFIDLPKKLNLVVSGYFRDSECSMENYARALFTLSITGNLSSEIAPSLSFGQGSTPRPKNVGLTLIEAVENRFGPIIRTVESIKERCNDLESKIDADEFKLYSCAGKFKIYTDPDEVELYTAHLEVAKALEYINSFVRSTILENLTAVDRDKILEDKPVMLQDIKYEHE